MKDDSDMKDIAVNLIQETLEPDNDGAAGALLAVILEYMVLEDDDEFTKERKQKDAEKVAYLDRVYKEQKILEQQIDEILSGHTIDTPLFPC